MTDTPHAVIALQISELIRDIQQSPPADVDAALGELTESGVNYISAAQHAGITIASRDGKLHTSAATSEYPALLDKFQQLCGEGPCLSAAWEQHIIKIDDVETEQRWPAYCRDTREETPIRSIMAFQLYADHQTMGALNFYSERAYAFDAEAVESGLIVATHAALAWNLLRRDEQFRSALASRDIIGQAKGMLMERFKIDAVQAFEVLKRLSQNSNTPLVGVAQEIVTADRATDVIGR
ncbi:GAF and ANTAR domain-containing protein [Mycobacterium sp. 155]|uniref:GAF and ANTAR domain-containing protein n=1 Tax=Mycobacterium sp. 155 TaxID=1157943 RepID=UPI000376308C|nr:GAF and ANTAR domain-containing protein [Mycobacterium sp. 155]